MARARVELKGAASHTRSNGKVMKKNRPEIMTSAADIEYYRAQAGFVITDLEEAASPPPKAKPAKVAAKAPEKKGIFGSRKDESEGEEAPL